MPSRRNFLKTAGLGIIAAGIPPVLDLGGAHPLDVERETGSLGLMTAASLKLTPATTTEPLQRVDEAELSESDRSSCSHAL